MPAKPRFGYHFAKLHRLMIALSKEEVSKLEIQPSQTPFIAGLLKCPQPITQEELSTHLAIDKAATARALDQLEKKGYVVRVVNPENRRQKLVSTTPKAHAIANRLYAAFQTASDILTRDFSPEELTTILNLLNRMIDNGMGEKYGSPS